VRRAPLHDLRHCISRWHCTKSSRCRICGPHRPSALCDEYPAHDLRHCISRWRCLADDGAWILYTSPAASTVRRALGAGFAGLTDRQRCAASPRCRICGPHRPSALCGEPSVPDLRCLTDRQRCVMNTRHMIPEASPAAGVAR